MTELKHTIKSSEVNKSYSVNKNGACEYKVEFYRFWTDPKSKLKESFSENTNYDCEKLKQKFKTSYIDSLKQTGFVEEIEVTNIKGWKLFSQFAKDMCSVSYRFGSDFKNWKTDVGKSETECKKIKKQFKDFK